jgi:hypothetical protein
LQRLATVLANLFRQNGDYADNPELLKSVNLTLDYMSYAAEIAHAAADQLSELSRLYEEDGSHVSVDAVAKVIGSDAAVALMARAQQKRLSCRS